MKDRTITINAPASFWDAIKEHANGRYRGDVSKAIIECATAGLVSEYLPDIMPQEVKAFLHGRVMAAQVFGFFSGFKEQQKEEERGGNSE